MFVPLKSLLANFTFKFLNGIRLRVPIKYALYFYQKKKKKCFIRNL